MKTRSSSWEMYQTLRDEEKRRKREINNRNFHENYFADTYYGGGYLQSYDKYGEGHRHNNRAW